MTQEQIEPDCRVAPDYYKASQAGLAELSEIKKRTADEAEDKRQRRFQNQISVAQVLVPCVTFVLGLVVEHFAGIIEAFRRLVENFVK